MIKNNGNYSAFLKTKILRQSNKGKQNITNEQINPILFDFQKDITLWGDGRQARLI